MLSMMLYFLSFLYVLYVFKYKLLWVSSIASPSNLLCFICMFEIVANCFVMQSWISKSFSFFLILVGRSPMCTFFTNALVFVCGNWIFVEIKETMKILGLNRTTCWVYDDYGFSLNFCSKFFWNKFFAIFKKNTTLVPLWEFWI